MSAAAPTPLVAVRGLEKHFPIRRGVLRRQVGAVRAVDGVSFEIRSGETLGLVGESGSGKSTTGRALLRLVRPTAGEVRFEGRLLDGLDPAELRRTRRDMQMVFQDPYASLDPRMRVRAAIGEPLDIHRIGTKVERRRRVDELLALVGLGVGIADRYPAELSGGQRQRVGIARALATGPKLLVADEPISALDVSIQAQIVNLLEDLKEELGLTYLFIAHDLAMVRHISDRVAVMYLGRLVEVGERDAVFDRPLHPYTRALLDAVPLPDPGRSAPGVSAETSEIPSPAHPPVGCRYHPRCPLATDTCRQVDPEMRDLGLPGRSHRVACHHASVSPTGADAPSPRGVISEVDP